MNFGDETLWTALGVIALVVSLVASFIKFLNNRKRLLANVNRSMFCYPDTLDCIYELKEKLPELHNFLQKTQYSNSVHSVYLKNRGKLPVENIMIFQEGITFSIERSTRKKLDIMDGVISVGSLLPHQERRITFWSENLGNPKVIVSHSNGIANVKYPVSQHNWLSIFDSSTLVICCIALLVILGFCLIFYGQVYK